MAKSSITKKTRPVRTAALTMKTKDIDDLILRLDTMALNGDSDEEEATAASQPFRFFDLPSELRLRVYEHLLIFPKTLDLDPSNTRILVPRLKLFFVNRRMHTEASHVFYSRNTFRIFAIHGRFFHTKRQLLTRLPLCYIEHLTSLELRLGPGWTKPPTGWVVDGKLALAYAKNVRLLKIFVECDPASDPVFEGFRNKDHGDEQSFYTQFCVAILASLFEQLVELARVEFDAYPSVSRSSPLLQTLVDKTKQGGKAVLWGPERGWDKIVDVDLGGMLQKLGIGTL